MDKRKWGMFWIILILFSIIVIGSFSFHNLVLYLIGVTQVIVSGGIFVLIDYHKNLKSVLYLMFGSLLFSGFITFILAM